MVRNQVLELKKKLSVVKIGVPILLSLILIAVFIGLSGTETEADETKVAVVVLDASDWQVVNQLREEDRVPNIEEYMEEGVYGNMTAPRAFSPVSWTKVATGKSEENINIEGWNTEEDGNRRMVRREDVENKRIWDYLNDVNKSTGISSWLLTWPVEEVDGFMISGPMRTSNNEIYYPENEFGDAEKDTIREGSEWLEAYMGIKRKEQVDFLALGMKNLDVIQHHLWKFVDPEPFGMEMKEEHEEYREHIYTEYENLDQVLEEFDDDWNVMVFGTSGFRPESEVRGWIGPSYAQNVNSIIEWTGLGEFEERTVRGTTVDEPLPGTKIERCSLNHGRFGSDVVNETTQRFQLCVLDEDLDFETVKQDLKSVKYRDGRDLIFDLEYHEESTVIIGEKRIFQDGIVTEEFREAPTDQPLVDGPIPYIDPALGVELPNGTERKLWIGPEKNGDHPPGTDSIFLAKGPAFKEGEQLDHEVMSTIDVAPTVLYMYDLPVPESMDGRPQKEIFKESFKDRREFRETDIPTSKGETYLEEYDQKRDTVLKQRLSDIGYIVG